MNICLDFIFSFTFDQFNFVYEILMIDESVFLYKFFRIISILYALIILIKWIWILILQINFMIIIISACNFDYFLISVWYIIIFLLYFSWIAVSVSIKKHRAKEANSIKTTNLIFLSNAYFHKSLKIKMLSILLYYKIQFFVFLNLVIWIFLKWPLDKNRILVSD